MKIKISPLTLFYFAACLLISHRLSVVAVCTAVLMHELTHLILLWLMGGSATALTVTPIGLTIDRNGLLNYQKEIWLSLSAPLFNLLLAGVFAFLSMDRITLEINLGLGLVNLLPICPLDGGKALTALLSHCGSADWAQRIMGIISAVFMLILWLFSIAICIVLNGSLTPLLLVSGLFFSSIEFDRRYK